MEEDMNEILKPYNGTMSVELCGAMGRVIGKVDEQNVWLLEKLRQAILNESGQECLKEFNAGIAN